MAKGKKVRAFYEIHTEGEGSSFFSFEDIIESDDMREQVASMALAKLVEVSRQYKDALQLFAERKHTPVVDAALRHLTAISKDRKLLG
ncbi:MAG TPA: hypothetical protein VGG64_01115 [Pirellulales bacterium]|jgi:hypothetical protein